MMAKRGAPWDGDKTHSHSPPSGSHAIALQPGAATWDVLVCLWCLLSSDKAQPNCPCSCKTQSEVLGPMPPFTQTEWLSLGNTLGAYPFSYPSLSSHSWLTCFLLCKQKNSPKHITQSLNWRIVVCSSHCGLSRCGNGGATRTQPPLHHPWCSLLTVLCVGAFVRQ